MKALVLRVALFAVFFLALLKGVDFFVGAKPPALPKADAVAAEAAKPVVQPMSLGFTPEQLRTRFNEQAKARDVEYRISGVTLQPGSAESDKWVYSFTNRIGFLATTNKPRGDLRSVTYMASGDGTAQSGVHILFALLTLIHAIDPALSNETANQMALALLSVAKNKGATVERIANGIRYGAGFVEGAGLIVAINAVQ